MNPFLNKPLRKVQPGQNLKNTSAEHRPSKFLGTNVRNSKILVPAVDRKALEAKKNKNPSPTSKFAKNVNNINLISNKEDDKNDNSMIDTNRENRENANNSESNGQMFSKNLTIEKNINFTYPKSSEGLVFANNDEIFEYLKLQIKDGKIRNALQKLEIKKTEKCLNEK